MRKFLARTLRKIAKRLDGGVAVGDVRVVMTSMTPLDYEKLARRVAAARPAGGAL